MAVDIYLTIPNIPGESISAGFKNAIEVFSFSWGLSNPAAISSGSGILGAGKVEASDLSIVKNFDVSSPLLMKALALGTHLSKVTLSLVKPNTTGKVGMNGPAFLTYDFTEVFVTSVQDSGSDAIPTESVSFAASAVTVTYHEQNPNGSIGTTVFTFNFARTEGA